MHKLRHSISIALITLASISGNLLAADFQSDFKNMNDRVWIGRHYWANPMEDWRIRDGRLECITSGPDRNVHVLTHRLGNKPGTLEMSVRMGLAAPIAGDATMGFIVAAQGEIHNYRAAALRGKGITAGMTLTNDLFIGRKRISLGPGDPLLLHKEMILRLNARPAGDGYLLTLAAIDAASGKTVGTVDEGPVAAGKLEGNLALHAHHAVKVRSASAGLASFWFSDWKIIGTKVEAHPDRLFGPILWAMHSLSSSRGEDGHVMKMTAQMPPLGDKDPQSVVLQTRGDGAWRTVGQAVMDPDARTATFRIPKWSADRDVPY
jgi:hypothetical protein